MNFRLTSRQVIEIVSALNLKDKELRKQQDHLLKQYSFPSPGLKVQLGIVKYHLETIWKSINSLAFEFPRSNFRIYRQEEIEMKFRDDLEALLRDYSASIVSESPIEVVLSEVKVNETVLHKELRIKL